MAINISVQYYGGLLPVHYTVDPRLLPSRKPFKYHVEVLSLQPMNSIILLLPCLMYYIVSVMFLLLVWCPCMTINVIV